MPLELRASLLELFNDCARLAAARMIPKEIADAGYTMRQLPGSVGRSIGTAVHAGLAVAMQAKKDGNDPFAIGAEVRDAAMESLARNTAHGCVWDDTSPRMDAAQFQTSRMLKSLAPIIRKSKPVLVEELLTAQIGDITLTGHPDWVDAARIIPDLKTGVQERPHWAQFGAYSFLVRSQAEPVIPSVRACAAIQVKRAPRTKPQPAPIVKRYDVTACETAALATIKRVERDVTAFRETGDPESFAPNPMTMLCGDKYCSAWGTDWCAYGRPRKG